MIIIFRNTEIRFRIEWSISPISGLIYTSVPHDFALIRPKSQPPVFTVKAPAEYSDMF